MNQSSNGVSTGNNSEKTFKVIVIGDTNVGKTTLTYRFCEGSFLNYTEATIGVDFRSRAVEIDGELITLQLWDTAGQERYRMSMVRHYYRNTDAVAFVYDVTNPSSFRSIKKWIDESNMNCLPDIPKILIGNKCDGNVAVPTNEAQILADSHNMPLFETSARLDSECDNVEAIFLTLAHKLKNNKRFLPSNSNNESLKVTGHVVNNTTNQSQCGYC
ncbi:ras-related protein Rab-33B-like [Sitophilus oryzae]|uniref:Ras-related protein Rab-33B-like n=1 Tax=Sitophilus oryzae TaxID=7048 RepID=A0A6J2X4J0_SITOR|nr:ras-related protein Rab-33B-like [Sitophilus oryzae]